MKKALVVANLFGFVGFLLNDIQTLQALDYKVVFAANDNSTETSPMREYLDDIGVTFYPLSLSTKKPLSKSNHKSFLEIKEILNNEHFDLVHCHTPISGFITRVAANKYRKTGTKVIYTTHGFPFARYSSSKEWYMYFWLEKIASLFTDTIITINKEDCENARKLHCKDVRRINGVGVDTAHYHDVEIDIKSYKTQLGLPLDKIMVLSVGELSRRKNHQIIIKALSLLPNKDDYIYVICGGEVSNSGFAEGLRNLADEHGVTLYLLGHRNDIPQIMHCSDIGAIPSIREGLGLAGIQSLCAGVPLVGTGVQGIKEYILDGVSGHLCEPFDAEGYARSIIRLSNKDYRQALSRNCYDIAKQFDVGIARKQMKDIYTSILCSDYNKERYEED